MRRDIPPSLRHEIKVSGLESCRALYASRPGDITRIYVIDRMERNLQDVLTWAERNDVESYTVTIDELSAFTETVHHDGVCFVARKKRDSAIADIEHWLADRSRSAALMLLDGVKNPNNVGAVARSCAFFGVPYLAATPNTAMFSQAAVRVAQGATEAVGYIPLKSTSSALAIFSKLGITLVTTSSHGGTPLHETPLPARSIICLGSENAGVSAEIEKAAIVRVTIPGAGRLESLNLAQAASILLWEHWRVHRANESRPAPRATSNTSRSGGSRDAPSRHRSATKPGPRR
ncbi:MAG: hypothetical protein H7Z43_04390 [Clostridia bacterium]|nr:hypothetical protein [Deltaproteobacteria bacterium]